MNCDPGTLDSVTRSSLLLSIVVPRPIALVTTSNADYSNINIAPFSLFNLVSLDPPVVYISIQKAELPKQTVLNIRGTGEFVVNIPNYAISEKMNKAATPRRLINKSKLEFCGLTKIESEKIRTAGIKEALIRLECRLHSSIDFDGYEMFLGNIVNVYCDDSIIKGDQVSIEKYDFISRLGPKELYLRTEPKSIFRMKRHTNVYEG